jgi:hypothetical protein
MLRCARQLRALHPQPQDTTTPHNASSFARAKEVLDPDHARSLVRPFCPLSFHPDTPISLAGSPHSFAGLL